MHEIRLADARCATARISATCCRCVAGVLACLDGYMNIAMEQTEEYVNGQLKAKYGDTFIRGNNGAAAQRPSHCDTRLSRRAHPHRSALHQHAEETVTSVVKRHCANAQREQRAFRGVPSRRASWRRLVDEVAWGVHTPGGRWRHSRSALHANYTGVAPLLLFSTDGPLARFSVVSEP